jgi:ABC-type nitrate/sulfonate/bicarbonate transport system substrate-binding protein
MPRASDSGNQDDNARPRLTFNFRRTAMLAAAAVLAIAFSIYVSNQYFVTNAVSDKPLRIGYQNSPAMALVMVAEHEKLFDKRGVSVALQEFTAGKFALQAFLGGSLDGAIAGDVPIGLALLQGQQFLAVGEVLKNSHDEVRMVVRNPDGCSNLTPETYFSEKQRSIATSFGGGPQFFTIRFLEAHKIPLSEVKLISQQPQEMPAALQAAAVDGIAVFDPAAGEAESLLGSHHCTFPDPKNYRQHYVLVVRNGDIRPHPDPRLVRFIGALKDAEQFILAHPSEAQDIVGDKTKLGAARISAIWGEYQFGVTLDPGLAELWAQEADWHRSDPGANVDLAHVDYTKILDPSVLNAR